MQCVTQSLYAVGQLIPDGARATIPLKRALARSKLVRTATVAAIF